MKYFNGILYVGLIILLACLGGCISRSIPQITQTTSQPVTSSPAVIKLSTIEPSDMALKLPDLPAGFKVQEMSERTPSGLNQLAVDLGWKKGYYVAFQRGNVDSALIQQTISVYSIEKFYPIKIQIGNTSLGKVNQILFWAKTDLLSAANESIKIDELYDPKIGDSSQAFRYRHNGYTAFIIQFVKNDVFEDIRIGGSSPDYETLKKLAMTAAEKVK